MKLSGNRIRTRAGKILHFGSARKRARWEKNARAYRHGWRPKKRRRR